MDEREQKFCSDFYATLEKGISELPQEYREKLYFACAANCASAFALKEQQRQFEECNCDLDSQYEKYGKSEYYFANIIEKGHVYEIGYPTKECFCPMVQAGMAKTVTHCECARQSIVFTLQTLLPQKKIIVETLHSALSNAQECRFRVTVED